MRTALFVLALSVLTFSLFQTGCEDRSVTPSGTDWDAVKAIISEYPDVFRLGFFDTAADSPFYREMTQSSGDIEQGQGVRFILHTKLLVSRLINIFILTICDKYTIFCHIWKQKVSHL